ncbi:putative cytochrome P450 [Durotheca rogersii]|uniref:putative cytochrome P450 n=1 Tax=Durotheca rogersii TaxID=419775 RepID=UPI0022208131|nr:putative cytochrome P450 [Durotheca rogersii]KAI5865326.1 putative cytochrome P450 [Durotheca rogersii]
MSVMEFAANESAKAVVEKWQELFVGEDRARHIVAAVAIVIAIAAFASWLNGGSKPRRLPEGIPFVTNTLQYLVDNKRFMEKATDALSGRNIAQFYLGGVPVYLISGVQNIQMLFGRGHKVGSEDIFVQKVLPRLYKMPPHHVSRFANDKSGRGKVPAPGYEDTPPEKRYWQQYEHVHTEYLSRTQYMKPVIEVFSEHLSERLEKFPVGELSTISVMDFCKREIARVAMSTLLGPTIFKLNPGFLDAFWEFDENVFMLTLGFPKWLYPRPYNVHDRYIAMVKNYVDSAFQNFDWDGPGAEAAWEPHFGARACREIAKWLRDGDFLDTSIAGALGSLVFAQNSNTIPTAIWTIMEVAKDPELFQAVREEVSGCWTTDAATGARGLDVQKVSTSPLLQSVLAETLRLRTNFNIIRQAKEPLTIDGHAIRKGTMLQAPMMVAHYDEAVWGAPGHPAAEFWADRHIKHVEVADDAGRVVRKRTFAMAGRPSSYFPFGGGAPICPGRHFAKHEIMTMIGLIVSRFDIEKVEWTKLDGSPSDRMAYNDQRFCGGGGMPPDRDLKITWRRLW